MRPGITFPREELLMKVWENNGLIPSANNLSNHISFLRKTFRQLGIADPVIITVPGEGFCLTDARAIAPATDIATADEEPGTRQAARLPVTVRLPARAPLQNALSLIIPVVVLVLAMALPALNEPEQLTAAASTPLLTIGSCSIFVMGSTGHQWRQEKIQRLREFIRLQQIDCSGTTSSLYFEFFNFQPREARGDSSLFVAQCHTPRKGKMQCENYLSARTGTP